MTVSGLSSLERLHTQGEFLGRGIAQDHFVESYRFEFNIVNKS